MVQEKTQKKQMKVLTEEEKQKKREEDEQNELYKILTEKSFEQYKKKRQEIEKRKLMLQKLKKPTKEEIEMAVTNPGKKDIILKRCNSAVSMRSHTSRSTHFVTSWIDPTHPKHSTSTTKNVDYYSNTSRPSTASSIRKQTSTSSSLSASRPTTALSQRREGISDNRMDITNEVIKAKDKFELEKLDTALLDFRKQTDRKFMNYPWISAPSASFSFVNSVNYSTVDNHVPTVNLQSKSKRYNLESNINDLCYDVQYNIIEKPVSVSNLDIYLTTGRDKSSEVSTKAMRTAATFQLKLVDEAIKKQSKT